MSQPDDSGAVKFSAAGAVTVALLMATAALGHFNRVGMAVAGGERLMTEYKLSETELGMVYSAFLLAYTVCMIPGGWLIDRCGAPFALTAMGIGMSVFVAATGAIGLVAGLFSHALLLCIRACAGVCSAPLHPASARMVSLCVPKSQQTFANGLVTGAAVLGIAVTFHVFGGLIDLVGWQKAFLVSSAATATLAVVWTLATRSAPTGATSIEFVR